VPRRNATVIVSAAPSISRHIRAAVAMDGNIYSGIFRIDGGHISKQRIRPAHFSKGLRCNQSAEARNPLPAFRPSRDRDYRIPFLLKSITCLALSGV